MAGTVAIMKPSFSSRLGVVSAVDQRRWKRVTGTYTDHMAGMATAPGFLLVGDMPVWRIGWYMDSHHRTVLGQ